MEIYINSLSRPTPVETETPEVDENLVGFGFSKDEFIKALDKKAKDGDFKIADSEQATQTDINEGVTYNVTSYFISDALSVIFYETEKGELTSIFYICNVPTIGANNMNNFGSLMAETFLFIEPNNVLEIYNAIPLGNFLQDFEGIFDGENSKIIYSYSGGKFAIGIDTLSKPTSDSESATVVEETESIFRFTKDEYIDVVDSMMGPDDIKIADCEQETKTSVKDGVTSVDTIYTIDNGVDLIFYETEDGGLTSIYLFCDKSKNDADALNNFGFLNALTLSAIEPNEKSEIDKELQLDNFTDDFMGVEFGEISLITYSVDEKYLIFSVSPSF